MDRRDEDGVPVGSRRSCAAAWRPPEPSCFLRAARRFPSPWRSFWTWAPWRASWLGWPSSPTSPWRAQRGAPASQPWPSWGLFAPGFRLWRRLAPPGCCSLRFRSSSWLYLLGGTPRQDINRSGRGLKQVDSVAWAMERRWFDIAPRCPQVSSDDRPRHEISPQDGAGGRGSADGTESGGSRPVRGHFAEDVTTLAEGTRIRAGAARRSQERLSAVHGTTAASFGPRSNNAFEAHGGGRLTGDGEGAVRVLHPGSDAERHRDGRTSKNESPSWSGLRKAPRGDGRMEDS